MDLEQLIQHHSDAVTVKRVFGEPYEKNGLTVTPAAAVIGGGGGGEGEQEGDPSGRGAGTGYGLLARPVGAYVISGETIRWQPAFDVNRVVAGAFVLAGLALLTGRRRSR